MPGTGSRGQFFGDALWCSAVLRLAYPTVLDDCVRLPYEVLLFGEEGLRAHWIYLLEKLP